MSEPVEQGNVFVVMLIIGSFVLFPAMYGLVTRVLMN